MAPRGAGHRLEQLIERLFVGPRPVHRIPESADRGIHDPGMTTARIPASQLQTTTCHGLGKTNPTRRSAAGKVRCNGQPTTMMPIGTSHMNE